MRRMRKTTQATEKAGKMNRKTGKIYTPGQLNIIKQYTDEARKFAFYMQNVAATLGCSPKSIPTPDLLMEMKIDPTEEQMEKGRISRNDPCPCGSGKKFKKCCMVM